MRTYAICLSILLTPLVKGDTLEVDGSFDSEYVGAYTDYILAPRNATIQEVKSSKKWKKSNYDVLNFGSISNAAWLKFQIINTGDDPRTVVLSAGNPYLDIIRLFQDDADLPISQGGDCNKQKLNTPFTSFYKTELVIEPSSLKTYYIQVYGNENITLPFVVESKQRARITSNLRRFIFGGFSGIFSIVGLMTFLLYLIVRNALFVYYLIYLLCVYFAQIFTSIDNSSYFILGVPFDDIKLYIAITAVGPAALLFVSAFLSVNTNNKRHIRTFTIYSLVYLSIPIVYLVIGQIWAFRVVNALNFFGCLIVIVYAVRYFQPTRLDVKVLLGAWIVFLTGIMLYTLMNVNILPYSLLNHYLMPVGSAIETLLLAAAIGIKVKQLFIDLSIASGRIDQLDESLSEIEKTSNKSILRATTHFFQPHFVYNLLTSVNNGIRSGYTFKTQEMVNQAAKIIRKGLNYSNEMYISVEEECLFLKEYFELESLKSKFNLQFEISIDPEIIEEEIQIPPLITQVYVENAIKHALTAERCTLTCDFKLKDHAQVVCKIEDWGIGFSSEERYGIQRLKKRIYGSDNIKKRVNVLRSMGYPIDILITNKSKHNQEDSGVKVEITYPADITRLKEYD